MVRVRRIDQIEAFGNKCHFNGHWPHFELKRRDFVTFDFSIYLHHCPIFHLFCIAQLNRDPNKSVR